MGREQIAVSQLTMKGLNVISHTRRGFRFITFRRSAVGFLLTGRLDRRAYNDLSGRHDHFQSLGHVAKIFSREKQTLRCNDYAVFRFHGRSVVGLATSIFFTRRKAPRSIMSGVESSSRSRSVRSWVDQNSSSCSHESNLGMARFFPILLSLPGGQVHSGHQKIASFSMELQDDFEESACKRRTDDDNSNRVFLVPQPDRPTMHERFLDFVLRDPMFFPYLLFDECFNDESAEPQVTYILSAEPRENKLRSTGIDIRADKGSSTSVV
jgi:hypothetical protein